MSNETIQNLVMVGAVAALGYALYQHFQPGGSLVGTKTAAASGLPSAGTSPLISDPGREYDTANPGAFISLKDLFSGVIHDIYNGDAKYASTPATINEIERSFLSDYYGTPGNERPGDFMRNPGAYW